MRICWESPVCQGNNWEFHFWISQNSISGSDSLNLQSRFFCPQNSQQFPRELIPPSFPQKMCRGLFRPFLKLECRAPLGCQCRTHQPNSSGFFWSWVIKPPIFWGYRQHSRLERHCQLGAASAVGKEGIPLGSGQDLGENHGNVSAAQEIPFPTAAGKEREFLLVAPALVPLQVLEEE